MEKNAAKASAFSIEYEYYIRDI